MMKDMCCRVADGYVLTTFSVNLRFHRCLWCNLPFDYLTLMNEQIGNRFYSINNFKFRICACDNTNIADLTARVSVKRCLIQDDGNLLSLMDTRCQLISADEGDNFCFCERFVISQKRGGIIFLENVRVNCLALVRTTGGFPIRTTALPLLRHARGKPIFINSKVTFPRQHLCKVQWESKGII